MNLLIIGLLIIFLILLYVMNFFPLKPHDEEELEEIKLTLQTIDEIDIYFDDIEELTITIEIQLTHNEPELITNRE